MELGKKQFLTIMRIKDVGAFLGKNEEDVVLLPKKQIPSHAKVGDELEVFLYKDSSDRIIATVNPAKLHLGEFALLKVIEVTAIGAFLDWGLEKDLLLPFKEQTKRVKQGEFCLVTLYVDKSERLCATMKLYPYLNTSSPYQKDDRVMGIVYEIKPEMGIFIAVDSQYCGRIPLEENFGYYEVGDSVEARVTKVKEDGKLDLSAREKAFLQMDIDAQIIWEKIEQNGGFLPFTDKTSPEVIKKECQLSKNAFKRAVGKLLKEKKIKITDQKIEKIK
ncbi:RNA-binding protein [Clostridia bacterium]|nr:RNA-binding protein [Clostridia bacterium]